MKTIKKLFPPKEDDNEDKFIAGIIMGMLILSALCIIYIMCENI